MEHSHSFSLSRFGSAHVSIMGISMTMYMCFFPNTQHQMSSSLCCDSSPSASRCDLFPPLFFQFHLTAQWAATRKEASLRRWPAVPLVKKEGTGLRWALSIPRALLPPLPLLLLLLRHICCPPLHPPFLFPHPLRTLSPLRGTPLPVLPAAPSTRLPLVTSPPMPEPSWPRCAVGEGLASTPSRNPLSPPPHQVGRRGSLIHMRWPPERRWTQPFEARRLPRRRSGLQWDFLLRRQPWLLGCRLRPKGCQCWPRPSRQCSRLWRGLMRSSPKAL